MVTFLVCLVVVGGAVVIILRVTLADVVKPATSEAEPHGGAVPRSLVDTARKATTFLIPTDEAGHARRPRAEAVDAAPERRGAAAFLIPTGAVTAKIRPEPTPPPQPGVEADAPSVRTVEPVVGPSLDERVAAARAREAARVAEAERSAAAAEAERLAAAQRAAAEQRVAEQRQREAEAERVLADEQVDEAARVAQAETARMARLDAATTAAVPVLLEGRAGAIDPIDQPIVWRPDPTWAGRAEATAVATLEGEGTAGWPAASGAVAEDARPPSRPATSGAVAEDARPPSRPATAAPRPARPTFARRLLARLAGAVKLVTLLVLVGTGLALLLGAAVVLFTLGVRAAIGG